MAYFCGQKSNGPGGEKVDTRDLCYLSHYA